MNLHYMEYLEAALDEDFQTLVDDWIEANPAYGQVWWQDSWNSYALSLRVVVWMQQLASRRDRLPNAFLWRANASLALQLRFLERRLETDLGGNHLIKNIKALVWASAYFPGPQAQRWRDRGLALLTQELRRQFLSDGMHFERSPSYHAQVFADLLECRHALVGASAAIPKTLDKTLVEMAQVIADLAHPDGNVAQFNDAGLTMAYAPVPCLAAFQAVTGQAAPKPRRVFALPAAGYFGFRSADLYLAVDCGRIGPDDLPAHGHGDILSFELSIGGLRFIVDPGVFEYIAGEKRAASRSAMTHNTLCIEGADQADFYGAFRCGRRPDVRVRKYEASSDGFLLEGDHNGFAQAPGRPTPVRRFTVTAREVLIEDWIEGASDQPAWTGLLLHPDVTITEEDDGLLLCREGQRLRLSSEMDFSIEAAVWWPDMGIEYQTKRLRFRVPQTPAPVAVRLVLV